MVTDYEVWPEGTILFEGGSIADVSPDDSLLGDAEEVHERPDSCSCPASWTCRSTAPSAWTWRRSLSRLGELSRALLSTGTTAYLPTIISPPPAYTSRPCPSSQRRSEDPPPARRCWAYTSRARS